MNYDCIDALRKAGVTKEDALALRRIAMTLHRWHELECCDANGNAIERDEATGIPYLTYDEGRNGKRGMMKVADRERGALKRLAAILARYPTLGYYVQGDPRGAALYILRPGDVPTGEPADSFYNRGVAVTK